MELFHPYNRNPPSAVAFSSRAISFVAPEAMFGSIRYCKRKLENGKQFFFFLLRERSRSTTSSNKFQYRRWNSTDIFVMFTISRPTLSCVSRCDVIYDHSIEIVCGRRRGKLSSFSFDIYPWYWPRTSSHHTVDFQLC